MLDYNFFYILSIPFYIVFVITLLFRRIGIKKICLYSFFYFYIISLISVTIFPIPIQGLDEIGKYGGENNNFIPLSSIFDILLNSNLSNYIKVKQIVGNIIIFIPMGFFLSFVWKDKCYFKRALLVGFLSSFSIELFQYIISFILGFNYKVTDIDDILLNTLGFVIGFVLYKFFYINSIDK